MPPGKAHPGRYVCMRFSVAAGCLVVVLAGLWLGLSEGPARAPASTRAVPALKAPARGPAPPPTGAYLGAFVDSDAANGQSREEVAAFEAEVGRSMRIA